MIPNVDLRIIVKDWPTVTIAEYKRCRDGGRRCPRCRAMMNAGVNPYTLEPLRGYLNPPQNPSNAPGGES